MRYPASEKLEIIRTVERSHLPIRRTLDKLGIPKTTFYRWYDLYQAFGEAGLEDRTTGPGRVWNRIPDSVRQEIVELALDEPELSSRELAVWFTDTKGYFVSEATVYRVLKAHDLITSPAFVVIKAADEFLTRGPGEFVRRNQDIRGEGTAGEFSAARAAAILENAEAATELVTHAAAQTTAFYRF